MPSFPPWNPSCSTSGMSSRCSRSSSSIRTCASCAAIRRSGQPPSCSARCARSSDGPPSWGRPGCRRKSWTSGLRFSPGSLRIPNGSSETRGSAASPRSALPLKQSNSCTSSTSSTTSLSLAWGFVSKRRPADHTGTAKGWRQKLTRQQLAYLFVLLPELLDLGADCGKLEVAGEVEVVFVDDGQRLDEADLLQLSKPFLDVFLGAVLQRRAHHSGMRAGAD